ncbi:MAG: hypothetical protein AB8B83_03475 [Bdellovibrionales bacterium]
MKNMLYLLVATFIFVCPNLVGANDEIPFEELYADQTPIEELFGSADIINGFEYHFIGDAEEEGALKLFVINMSSDHDLHDPTANSLSKISPAAGIKLNFEF